MTQRAITEAEWAALRHRATGELSATGGQLVDVLLPYQARLLRAVAEHDVTVCEKSRRTGATWALAADAVITAGATKASGGMDVMYIGYNLDMAREFIDEAAKWAAAFAPAVAGVEEILFHGDKPDQAVQAFRVRFASGFEIMALTSRPRSLRGRQGKVILDEAAFHEDLPELLKAAMAFLIWGGKVVVISTHDGDDNPFNELVRDIRAGKRPYALVRFDFDEALADGLYQRICEVTGKEWSVEAEAEWRSSIIAFYGDGADEELFCIPSRGSGLWLPRILIEGVMSDAPVLRLQLEPEFAQLGEAERRLRVAAWFDVNVASLLATLDPLLAHAFGMDFARTADRSVIWPVAITRLMKRVCPFVIEMGGVPYQQQQEVLFAVVDRLPRLAHGALDAGGNGGPLAEAAAQRYGWSAISQVAFSVEWYRQHMPPLKAAFEDGDITVPKDSEILDDFRAVRLVDGVARVPASRTKAGAGGSRHGDAAIAAALALFASRQDPPVTGGYQSAAAQSSKGDDYGDAFLPVREVLG